MSLEQKCTTFSRLRFKPNCGCSPKYIRWIRNNIKYDVILICSNNNNMHILVEYVRFSLLTHIENYNVVTTGDLQEPH